jgi:hypothetical protein
VFVRPQQHTKVLVLPTSPLHQLVNWPPRARPGHRWARCTTLPLCAAPNPKKNLDHVMKVCILPFNLALTHLSGDVSCRAIIDDVEKLDTIQDGFIHYQLLRFCRVLDSITPIRISCLVIVSSCRQHVDCKIADALLKKDTYQHVDGLGHVWQGLDTHCPPPATHWGWFWGDF